MFIKNTSISASLIEQLKLLFPDQKPQVLSQWIQRGFITSNDQILDKASKQIKEGSELTIQINHGFIRSPIYPTPIPVVFQSKDFIVLNKPSGLLSVNTSSKHVSCFSILKRHLIKSNVYVVHRLDQHASGLIVFALNKRSYQDLKEQLKQRTMKRSYVAITDNKLKKGEKGTWTSFLKEMPNFSVRSYPYQVEDAEHATSHYKVRGHSKKSAWMELELETGRKHQLRVHCQQANIPIYGDKKYGPEQTKANRLCLHAKKLSFSHPVTKKMIAFYAPVPKLFFKYIPNINQDSI